MSSNFHGGLDQAITWNNADQQWGLVAFTGGQFHKKW